MLVPYLKKYIYILASLTFLIPVASHAAQSGNIAVHIAEMHYHYPVRLMHPYLDYWHMKGPMVEEVAIDVLSKRYENVHTCDSEANADVLVFIEPHMFYNPQSRLFYAKLITKAYRLQTPSNVQKPFLVLEKEQMQNGDLNFNPDYALKQAYQKTMHLVADALAQDTGFTNAIASGTLQDMSGICAALDAQPVSKLYY